MNSIWMLIALCLLAWQVITIAVRLTPTKRDDEIASGIGRFFNLLFNATRTQGDEVEALRLEILEGLANEYVTKSPNVSRDKVQLLARQAVNRVERGYNLIPNEPRSVSGMALKTISTVVKEREMKTRFGRRLQRFFRRID